MDLVPGDAGGLAGDTQMHHDSLYPLSPNLLSVVDTLSGCWVGFSWLRQRLVMWPRRHCRVSWAWAQGGITFYRGGDKVIKWNILARRLAFENLLRICLNQ